MKSRFISSTLFLVLCLALAVGLLAGLPLSRKPETFFFQVDLLSDVAGTAQLFFDTGDGFGEGNSAVDGVRANQLERHKFALPSVKINTLRFDPINNRANLVLSGPVIVNSGGKVVHRFSLADISAGQQIASIVRNGNELAIACAEGGFDPALKIVGLPPLATAAMANDFQRAILAVVSFLALFLGGRALSRSSPIRATLGKVVTSFRARPVRALAVLSGAAVLLQFHPLLFPLQAIGNGDQAAGSSLVSAMNLSTYNSGKGDLQRSPPSKLIWGNIFLLISGITNHARWAIAVGILVAWWAYVLGCALISWRLTQSLSTSIVIGGCALFTTVWTTGVLPLYPPAVAAAPWALLAWGTLGSEFKSYRLYCLAGGVIFLANLQMIASECSLRVTLLMVAVTLAGALYIGLQPLKKSSRILGVGIGLGIVSLFWIIIATRLGTAVLAPGDGSAEAVNAVFSWPPIDLSLGFFEPIYLLQGPGSLPFPSANLVVLAGTAWSIARSDETFRQAGYIALAIPLLLAFSLGSGTLDWALTAVPGYSRSIPQLPQAAWYTICVFAPLIAIYGFAGLQKVCTTSDRGAYIGKATVLFLVPFVLYFGTTQSQHAYTFKTAYFLSIMIGWYVTHAALARSECQSKHRYSTVFVACALLLAWWPHAPYAHLLLRNVLVTP